MVRFPPWQSFSHVFFRPTSLAFIVSCHLKHYWFLGSEGEASSPFAKFNLLNLFCSILIISRALSWSHLQSLEIKLRGPRSFLQGKVNLGKLLGISSISMLSCQHALSCHIFMINFIHSCYHVNMFCHATFSN